MAELKSKKRLPLKSKVSNVNLCNLHILKAPGPVGPGRLNMVIKHCTLNKQTCIIHNFNQNVTENAKMYHTWLYVNCTMIYDHICSQFWRSVSASGHGNAILKTVDLATRVRSRPAQRSSLFQRLISHKI